jgi:hypothetical protein
VDGGGHVVGRLLLEEVAVGAGLDGLEEVVLLLGDGQHHDPDGRYAGPDVPGGVDAVAARHADVHEDHVRDQLLHPGDGLLAVARFGDHINGGLRSQGLGSQGLGSQGLGSQRLAQAAPVHDVIVGDHNPYRHGAAGPRFAGHRPAHRQER